MRFAKVILASMFVLFTATAVAAPRNDDQQPGPIQRIVKFLLHVVALDDGGTIGVPIP
jgi:hypothetical protein